MDNLDLILSREQGNACHIYLYESDTHWLAFEQSAYRFAQLFDGGVIECHDRGAVVTLTTDMVSFFDSQMIGSVDIVSAADDAIIMNCKPQFSEFEQWKSRFI